MSEPMTNIEIEDVLSSIRRLVSEDFRAPSSAQARVPDKLVLTPALRVVSGGDVIAEDESDTASAEAIITNEAAAAVLETALSTAADEWEPDGSETGSSDWAMEWDRERDRLARLHLRPTEAEPADDPAIEAEPVFYRAAGPIPAAVTLEDSEPLSASEEDLREMVREVIREELQGELGERITRSVRKLVRAEISRALAVRDIS